MSAHRDLVCKFSRNIQRILPQHETRDGLYMELASPSEVEMFVKWMYLGPVHFMHGVLFESPDSFGPELIRWCALAETLSAPELWLYMIILLSCWLDTDSILAEMAKLAYEQSTPGSVLRRLIVDVIIAKGPLHNQFPDCYKTDWQKLIRDGGDLVLDVSRAGGFCLWEISEGSQWSRQGLQRYMLAE